MKVKRVEADAGGDDARFGGGDDTTRVRKVRGHTRLPRPRTELLPHALVVGKCREHHRHAGVGGGGVGRHSFVFWRVTTMR